MSTERNEPRHSVCLLAHRVQRCGNSELRYTGPRLVVFQPVTTIEVQKLILSTPNKSCDLNKVILFQHV